MTKTTTPETADAARSGKRATLRTISELTGFSQSTVSLALRGGTTLREETSRKVAEAAAQLGYVPDRAGVRLRTGKTNVLALVLDRADESIDFSRYLIQGIGTALKITRYHMNVMPAFDRSYSVDTIRYILENRTADGVIITHTSAHDPRVELLMGMGFPFVTHGRTEFAAPHAYHDFHSEAFAGMAVERLVAKGCRRLMLVIGGETTTNFHNIVHAFEREAGRLQVETEVVSQPGSRENSAAMRAVGRQIARSARRPDGIVCDSELRAVCLISGLADEGVTLNRDVRFVCKQTSDLVASLFPMVDTIEEPVIAEGAELARLLIRRIAGDPVEELQTLSEPVPHWRD